jgi:hypothetical protein
MKPVTVQLPQKDAFGFYHASSNAHLILGQCEAAFDLIATLIEEGDHADHHGIPAVARLASQALAGLYATRPDALFDLSERIKEALPKGGEE